MVVGLRFTLGFDTMETNNWLRIINWSTEPPPPWRDTSVVRVSAWTNCNVNPKVFGSTSGLGIL